MSILNFAWGSHLDIEQFKKVIDSEPASWVKAKLPNHALTASALTESPEVGADLAADGGAPRLVARAGSEVLGILYEIDQSQWVILDKYERAWGFEPVEVKIETEAGEPVTAWAHNLVHFGPFRAPSQEFLQTMTRGYRQLGYPESAIQVAMISLTESG